MTEGTFLAEVLGAVLTQAKTGTVQVAIEFRLAEGPDAGSRITAYKPVTEKALKYTVADLRTCGWKGDDLEDLTSVKGGQVELVLAAEEFNGKVTTKVKFINEPGAAGAPAPQGIGKEWRDRIRALGGGLPF